MESQAGLSPLAGATLALVGAGVTPADLVARFAEQDAMVAESAAAARLEELAALGLARAVASAEGILYSLTPLGERLLGSVAADLGSDTRTDILSSIAHELRTPLTSVRTSVGLLLDPTVQPSPDQRQALLESIDRNAGRMQRVVGDILDMARFRAGQVHLQLRRFDATALARSAIGSIVPLAEAGRHQITLEAPREAVPVFADYRRLEQALVNLLSNAEKYSPEGAPITVRVAASDSEVSWSVTDRGYGIRPEDKSRLFERFFVAGRDRTDTTTGIGLGLPITLLIVEAHGGRIDVESTLGQGSTFRIVVPAAGPDEERDG